VIVRLLDLVLACLIAGLGGLVVVLLGALLRPLRLPQRPPSVRRSASGDENPVYARRQHQLIPLLRVFSPRNVGARQRRPNRGGHLRGSARRIVYLGTGQIAQVFPRNGVNLFLERECSDFGGYFEQLWNVHFPAGTRGRLDLTPRHHLVDVDFCRPFRRPRPAGLRAASLAWRELRFLLWLLPFLVRCRASVLTATNPYLQGLNAAVASRLLGVPYAVIITRDYDWDWSVLGKQAFRSVYPTRRLERAVGRWVLRHADLVLADRQYYRDFAVRNGARPERAVATRVLADTAFVTARADPAVRERYAPGAGPLLTYVGRLDADKFPLDLVECLHLVHQRFPGVTLVCAGTGSLSEEMKSRAAQLQVLGSLRLLGSLPLDDLPSLLASSDAVVAPHMGYTLVEAGLTGVPVVTYDYDFHGEIVTDGETGYLAPLRDVRGLAERACQVLEDPPAARRVGARLRQQLLCEHSLQAVVPLYRRAYDLVLERCA
jgi:glycosyltransferase involved in cell wall biosynthesis